MRTFEVQNKVMIHLDAIKIYLFNSVAFLSTITAIDSLLKIALLAASIIYTIVKIVAVVKNDLNITLNKTKGDKKNPAEVKEEIKKKDEK